MATEFASSALPACHHFGRQGSETPIHRTLLWSFDALIGNNDRHFYNWAVIRNVTGNDKPVFSPIYDTARGLFWNEYEDKLILSFQNKSKLNTYISNYYEVSSPKVGWEGVNKLNHFELVEKIITLPEAVSCNEIFNLCSESSISEVFFMIDNEFVNLMSPVRREVIKLCLQYRHNKLRKIFNFSP